MKSFLKTFVLLFVFIIVLVGCSENDKFNIVYKKEEKLKYTININKNKVSITCNGSECTDKNNTYTYSNQNITKLKNFLHENFDGNNIQIDNAGLKDNISNDVENNKINIEQMESNTKITYVFDSIITSENNFEISIEDAQASHTYYYKDSEIYKIYLKDDNSILVKKLTYSNGSISNIDSYNLNFSETNLNKIREFLRNDTYKYKNVDKENIYKSIIEKNERYLNSIDINTSLAYTIIYIDDKCTTPMLKVYSDNSYELLGQNDVIKTGNINFETKEIVESFMDDDSDEFSLKPYTIRTKYVTYSGKENNEYMSNIDVNLKQCLNLNS